MHPLHEIEKEYIKKILEKMGGNKYQAAQVLGIDRKTLYRKLGEMDESEKNPKSDPSHRRDPGPPRLVVLHHPVGMR